MRLLVVVALVGTVTVAAAEPAKGKHAPAKSKPPVVLAAAWKPTRPMPSKLLQSQGMTAYKAGNYRAAVAKFSAAMDASPSPELLYHAAQAYRLKGERAKALELYERYLEVAPDGAAAPVCRWHVERFRDTP
jgi:tetratricopeptide (TPR) repeat protein